MVNKMKKLRTVIRYECITSFKYIWIFYAILFSIILGIWGMFYINTGSTDKIGSNLLEINTFIYVGILGVLGFKEDFKMLIQNGFTRQYIFIATISLFVFISSIMAFVDTIAGIGLHALSNNYSSLFNDIYGFGHSYFIHWLWLFLAYTLTCCTSYLVVLIINKIGKKSSTIIGVTFGLVCFLAIPAILQLVIPETLANDIIEVCVKLVGYMSDGTIMFLYPVVFLTVIIGVLSFFSYFIIRRTELKG